MFRVVVRSNIRAEVANKLKKTVNQTFIADVQKEVVDDTIKRLMATGASPVQARDGKKRFDGYKDPKKYPGKKKAKRPVSLFLKGDLYNYYKAVIINGVRLSLGIPTSAPQKVKEYAEANNVGTYNDDGSVAIAARRFVPLLGESYAVSVMRKLKNLYAKRIRELITKK